MRDAAKMRNVVAISQHWLILLCAFHHVFDQSLGAKIHVGSIGNDESTCGAITRQCKTIEYTVLHVTKSNDVIVLTNSNSRLYTIDKAISLPLANITLIGNLDSPPTIYSSNTYTLFKVNTSVSIYVSNVIFSATGLLRYESSSSSLGDNLVVKIHNTTFDESPIVINISSKSSIGESHIDMIDSTIINCKKGIWVDVANVSTNLHINVSKSVFQNITYNPIHVVTSDGSRFAPPKHRVPNNVSKDGSSIVNQTNTSHTSLSFIVPLSSSSCKIYLYIDSSKFKDNIIDSQIGGAVYLQARFGVNFQVVIKNGKFVRNKISNQGGAVVINGRHGNHLNVDIDNVTFFDNIAGFSGGGLHVNAMSKNIVNITIRNSKFLRNEASENGAAISFNVDYENEFIVLVSHTLFMNNHAGFAGMGISLLVTAARPPFSKDGINLLVLKENRKELRVINSNFTRNKCSIGGAICLDNSELTTTSTCSRIAEEIREIFSFNVTIEGSSFNDNMAKQKGGAIYISKSEIPFFNLNVTDSSFIGNFASAGGAIYITNGEILITKSQFLQNKAEHGGSLNFYEGRTVISNSEFHNNSATTFGGAIYLRGRKYKHVFDSFFRIIQNSIFTNTIANSADASMFFGLSELAIINSSFVLTDTGKYENSHSIYAFSHESALKITSPFNVSCPPNFKLHNRTIHMLDGVNEIDYGKFNYLAIKCIPCGKGSYSVKRSSYFWDSYTEKSKIQQIHCIQCPAGGDCDNGHIVSQPNYWGYRVDNKIAFINCPFGYCSENSSTYNSCAKNRKGYLCGQCKDGKILSLFTSNCIDKARCQDNYEWFIVIITLVISIVLLVLFFLQNIIILLQSIFFRIKQRIYKGKEADIEDDSDKSSSGELFFSNLRLIFFFYQLQRFTKVPSKGEGSSSPKLQHVLGTIFSMSFIESVNEFISFCPSDEFNHVHKKALNIALWISILLICVILYCIICCIRYVCNIYNRKIQDITPQFQTIFIQLLILSYIPVSTSLFHLVHCVKIYDKYYFNILYTQGDVICYQTWQRIVIAFISLWTAPFVISIYIGISLLQRRMIKVKQFFITLIFPLMVVYFYIMKSYHKQNSKNNNEYSMKEQEKRNRTISENDEEYDIANVNGKMLHGKDVTASNDDLEIDVGDDVNGNNETCKTSEEVVYCECCSNEIEKKNANIKNNVIEIMNDNDDLCEEENRKDILEKLQGSFKYEYWLSIQKLRNISLVLVFTFADNIVKRLYITGFVLLVFLIVHFKKKPYKEKVMNWLESALLIMLILLDAMSIFDTMRFYGIPETDDIIGLRNAFQIVKIIILVLPLPLLGLFMIVHKCKTRKGKDKNK